MGKKNRRQATATAAAAATVPASVVKPGPAPVTRVVRGRNSWTCSHHTHTNPIFRIGECEIYGGAHHQVIYASLAWRLVISMAGAYSAPSAVLSMSDDARALLPNTLPAAEFPWLAIECEDGDAPELCRDDWETLVSDLSVLRGRVAVYCLGGHGRTGTALSILAALSGACDADPVAFIRKAYCPNAVETREQIAYIARMTGREIASEGSWEMSWGLGYSFPAPQRSTSATTVLPTGETVVTNAAGDVVWRSGPPVPVISAAETKLTTPTTPTPTPDPLPPPPCSICGEDIDAATCGWEGCPQTGKAVSGVATKCFLCHASYPDDGWGCGLPNCPREYGPRSDTYGRKRWADDFED